MIWDLFSKKRRQTDKDGTGQLFSGNKNSSPMIQAA